MTHKISPEAGAYDWMTRQQPLFEAGRIAILHDEFRGKVWELESSPNRCRSSSDVAQAPATTEGGTQTTMGNFGYASISEKSPNKEAAWEFIKWWASADVINPYAAKIGLQGVRTDSTPPYESTLLQQVQAEFVPKVQGVQIHENYYQMLTNLWPEIEKAYRGEQTGEEAVDEGRRSGDGADLGTRPPIPNPFPVGGEVDGRHASACVVPACTSAAA